MKKTKSNKKEINLLKQKEFLKSLIFSTPGKLKVLFICTANIARSKTAEIMFRNKFETKSAGTHPDLANTTFAVSKELLSWADIIIVFETEHLNFIEDEYPEIYASKKIINLEIPDVYCYMQEDLVKTLKIKVPNAVKCKDEITDNVMEYHKLDLLGGK